MNSYGVKQALELFLALFALYSPFAALPSYLPTLGRMDRKEHVRLAVALFVNVAAISLVSLWIGEKLLVLLGVSTAALSATAAAAEFSTGDRDDLDPGLAQQGIRAGITVIGEDHAR